MEATVQRTGAKLYVLTLASAYSPLALSCQDPQDGPAMLRSFTDHSTPLSHTQGHQLH